MAQRLQRCDSGPLTEAASAAEVPYMNRKSSSSARTGQTAVPTCELLTPDAYLPIH